MGTTIARESFQTDFHITKANSSAISSNITSIFQAGAFFGALFCFFCQSIEPEKGSKGGKSLTDPCFLVTERFGRKWTLQINVVVFIIGAVMMTAATHQLGLICKMTFSVYL